MTTKKLLLTQKITLILVFMSLIVSLSMGNSLPNNDTIVEMTPNSIDDLAIDLELNQTSIGRQNGALANLTLTNNGINPISDIEVNFTLEGEFAKFSSKYASFQTLSSLTLAETELLNVEVMLNLSKVDEDSAADVVLLFDASGSMGEELDSVKAEFSDVIDRLQDSIASLRLGLIVYGWGEYSPYPASSVNNYVPLTFDHQDVLDLIDELYADGPGEEPWGDAFAVIDSWTWREEVPKLAIIVGDEDCDPGNLVGVGSTDDWYNGTQLLDVITSLKEKEVTINSVITGTIGYVEEQFQWIAEYTGGECVYLDELLSGENPIDLPELIEGWTLELTREYFTNLNVNITWTEVTVDDFSTTLSEQILIDLAGPSITVSTIINEVPDTVEFEMTVYAKVLDISDISQVNMYYTYDDIDGPVSPTWHYRLLTESTDNTYSMKFINLLEGDKISFYIEALDTLSNAAETDIYNITIAITPKNFGTITEFIFTKDNSEIQLVLDFNNPNIFYHANSDLYIGYLWIERNQSITESLVANNVTITTLFSDPYNSLYKISALNANLGTNDSVKIIIGGNISISTIKIKWSVLNELIDLENFEFDKPRLDDYIRTYLFKGYLSTGSSSGYFTLIPYNTELVAKVTIFDSYWTEVGTVTAYENIELDSGVYYLWVDQVIREGYFSLYFGEEEVTTGDPYYREVVAYPLSIILPALVAIGLFLSLRLRKKSKEGAK